MSSVNKFRRKPRNAVKPAISRAVTRAVKNEVKKNPALKNEYKFLDTTLSGNSAMNSGGGFTNCLNLMATGDTASTREGREITIASVQIKAVIVHEDNTCANDQAVRFLLVWDKEPAGAAAALSAVLTSADGNGFRNVDNRSRFVVLMDKTMTLGPRDSTATQAVAGQGPHYLDFYKRLNLKTIFNSGNAGTIADINHGALNVYMCGTEASGTGGSAVGRARIRFIG